MGTYLEVEEERFNSKQIRLLYASKDYPLPRKLPLAANDVETELINYLSEKHAISCAEIRGLMDCFGPDELKLNAAIKQLKQTR